MLVLPAVGERLAATLANPRSRNPNNSYSMYYYVRVRPHIHALSDERGRNQILMRPGQRTAVLNTDSSTAAQMYSKHQHNLSLEPTAARHPH